MEKLLAAPAGRTQRLSGLGGKSVFTAVADRHRRLAQDARNWRRRRRAFGLESERAFGADLRAAAAGETGDGVEDEARRGLLVRAPQRAGRAGGGADAVVAAVRADGDRGIEARVRASAGGGGQTRQRGAVLAQAGGRGRARRASSGAASSRSAIRDPPASASAAPSRSNVWRAVFSPQLLGQAAHRPRSRITKVVGAFARRSPASISRATRNPARQGTTQAAPSRAWEGTRAQSSENSAARPRGASKPEMATAPVGQAAAQARQPVQRGPIRGVAAASSIAATGQAVAQCSHGVDGRRVRRQSAAATSLRDRPAAGALCASCPAIVTDGCTRSSPPVDCGGG